MDDIDYSGEIDLLLKTAVINDYAARKLADLNKDGLSEDLWQEAIDDYRAASDAGVTNDRDFNTFFYINLFADDLLKQALGIKISKEEIEEFKHYLFEHRTELGLNDLSAFRTAVDSWVAAHSEFNKTAHPNNGMAMHIGSQYDMKKWNALLLQASNMIRTGMAKESAFERVASNLSIPERYNFLLWLKYNNDKEFEKYDVNDKIKERESVLRGGMKNKIASDGQFYYIPKFMSVHEPQPTEEMPARDWQADEQYAIDFEAARNKLMSRVFAIDKLLERYRKVIKEDQVDAVEDALAELRKRIKKLKLASTVRDSIIKTANILNKLDFKDGADELIAIAADELLEGGPTKVIEHKSPTVAPETREVALDAAINKLVDISSVLKNRDLVRSLAEIDLMLHKLRMASFFPEIQEAQSKLIDAFGYASNKVEDLLPKLRGGLQTQPDIVSEPAPLEIEPKSTEQKQLGEEVKQLSSELNKSVKPAVVPKPKAKPAAAEDVDEPVAIKSVQGVD